MKVSKSVLFAAAFICTAPVLAPAYAQDDMMMEEGHMMMMMPNGTMQMMATPDQAMMDKMMSQGQEMTAGTVFMMHGGKMYMMPADSSMMMQGDQGGMMQQGDQGGAMQGDTAK